MKLPVITWLICALGLAAILVLVGPKRLLQPPAGAQGEAFIGGHFELSDKTGKLRTEKDFQGKYMLVYFGFTHCPDICPTTLLIMHNALTKLGNKADDITPILISLDPERDTPKVIGQYVENFGPTLVGLTGTPAQVKQAADAYRVYYSKVVQPGSEMGYLVDHSGFIYLMDTKGRYLAHFAHTISEGELTSKLRQFIK